MSKQQDCSHLSFSISRKDLTNGILLPKYYDPELLASLSLAGDDYDLPPLRNLLLPGNEGSRLGTWIRREHYGTGNVPFVRTSDLNGWRIRPDFKKSVSSEIFEQVATRQDVKTGDILMVAHGTYLVGTVAMVTEEDLPLVLQDHVFRLRLKPDVEVGSGGPVDHWLLLAALSTRFVRRQIRARQFSADIIDKIGDRHLEVAVPMPKEQKLRAKISAEVKQIIQGLSAARTNVSQLITSNMRMTRERSDARHGFSVARRDIARNILVPKYYDPTLKIEREAETIRTGARWVSLAEVVSRGILQANTGVEVGKMAYGTGSTPFVRTTDIAELELKADPRQGVSTEVYEQFVKKAGLAAGDVLLIRDGTYLVGSSALVTKDDAPALICGGIYRLRSNDPARLSPATLLGLLNLPLVRRQMRSKQFTRDVIDTLGNRVFEVEIPDPESAFAVQLGLDLSVQMAIKGGLRSQISECIRELDPQIPLLSRNRPGWSMRG